MGLQTNFNKKFHNFFENIRTMTPAQLHREGLVFLNHGDMICGFRYLYKSYDKETYPHSAQDLAYCFFNGMGCDINVLTGAKLLIENKLNIRIRHRMEIIINRVDCDLREVYLYGKYYFRNKLAVNGLARNIYHGSNQLCRQATLLFICWFQRNNILPRDLRRMIGEMIWESRVDPNLWNLRIGEPD